MESHHKKSKREEGLTKTDLAEMLGFVGLALAIGGISESLLELKLVCLLSGGICLPISFKHHVEWPVWVRWLLSLTVDAFLALVAWSAITQS